MDVLSRDSSTESSQGFLHSTPLHPILRYPEDIPLPVYVNLYISNLAELRKQFAMMKSTPEVPPRILATAINSGDGLTYGWANDIEQILMDIDALLTNIAAGWLYSGEIYSGEA